MIIRRMTLEDIPQAVAIEQECFSMPWSDKSFEDSLKREDTVFLVCVSCADTNAQAGEITGYVGMYLGFDEADITNVAVATRYRKQGCGQLLIEAACEAARTAGMCGVLLEVRKSNQAAISLYGKNGFEKIGIRKNFYQHPVEDAILMKVGL